MPAISRLVCRSTVGIPPCAGRTVSGLAQSPQWAADSPLRGKDGPLAECRNDLRDGFPLAREGRSDRRVEIEVAYRIPPCAGRTVERRQEGWQGLLIVRRDAHYPVLLELVTGLLGGAASSPPTDLSGTNPTIKRPWEGRRGRLAATRPLVYNGRRKIRVTTALGEGAGENGRT